MLNKEYGIHWFRRDLRIAGNENLKYNWKINQGCVLGIFCFDSKFLSRKDFSQNRFAFFLKTLKELKNELQLQGGDLLVINEMPQTAFPRLFDYLNGNQISLPKVITFGKDYEPYARQRDDEVSKLINSYGIKVHSERDHLVIEPHEILKDNGEYYKVYTPFSRKWIELYSTQRVQERIQSQKNINQYYERLKHNKFEKIFNLKWSDLKKLPFEDRLEEFTKENSKSVTISIPDAGFKVAYERLQKFSALIENYDRDRDFPELDATSMMSIYQKNGSFISSQILHQLNLKKNNSQYLKEIIWREFYYSILYHRPDVEHSAFLTQYKDLNWKNNEEWFQRWCKGETGFPIVDAGMRQLNQTGWMHNRVRMIVSSFLVKDLLIDWRWGENYFMKMLLDGDLAPNNGGWQWAASTGCDPQPYFRIFNPWLQSQKFDPEAQYIKKYIPELKNIRPKIIHHEEGDRGIHYPKPMIIHALQKQKALKLFK